VYRQHSADTLYVVLAGCLRYLERLLVKVKCQFSVVQSFITRKMLSHADIPSAYRQ